MVFSMTQRVDGATADRSTPEREFAMANVNVAGEDISGMVVVGTHGAKATGTLIFDGGAKPEGLNGVRVTAPSIDDGGPMPSFGAGSVKEAGTFALDGLIGTRLLRAGNLPKGWSLKRVTFNGQDVTDQGIDFKPGEDVSGIEIELTNRSTTINGTVTDDRGQPQKDYTVVIFSEDESKWTLPMNRWMTSARPDQEGRFRFNALPPGTYYAAAMEYVPTGEWQDPAWLSRAAKRATRVTLEEGAAKSLDLKLISGS
jgi:hypothetical protein